MKRLGLLVLLLAVGVFLGGCQKEAPKKKLTSSPMPPVTDKKETPKEDKAADEAKKKAEADKKAADKKAEEEAKMKAEADKKAAADKKANPPAEAEEYEAVDPIDLCVANEPSHRGSSS